MCIVLSDDFEVLDRTILTVNLKHFSAEISAYLTVLSCNAKTLNHKLGKKQLFVIPFPHASPHVTEEQLMLVDSPQTTYNNILSSLHSSNISGTQVLYEPTVGAQINIVPDYDSLLARVDWTSFSLSGRYALLMAELQGRYGKNYGFIVVMPSPNMQSDLFSGTIAWIWYGPSAYLPTACAVGTIQRGNFWILNEHVCSIQSELAGTQIPFNIHRDARFIHKHNELERKDIVISKHTIEKIFSLLQKGQMYNVTTPDERKPVTIQYQTDTVIHISAETVGHDGILALVNRNLARVHSVPILMPPSETQSKTKSKKCNSIRSYWPWYLFALILILTVARLTWIFLAHKRQL